MNTPSRFHSLLAVTLLALSPSLLHSAGGGGGKITPPDFTKGEAIPEGYTHDWNLGPTGLRGWMYSERLETSKARQIRITKVDPGSPADGLLKVGDVILGIGNSPFEGDPRTLFGKAITEAEKKENQGQLPLLCWQDGQAKTITIRLKTLGSYSATAPFNCSKSRQILKQGWKVLAEKIKNEPEKGHIITRALNASALLASGDPQYLPLLKKQVELLSTFNQGTGVRTWSYAYVNIFLAEYVLATKDHSQVENGLQRITKMIVDGQSAVGSWGHDFIDPSTKRLRGYGMMNAPGIPLTYSLVLARQAGVRVSGLDEAIAKSERFLSFYAGKGAIPYGDHAPWIETHDDNGKNGMAAVLFDHQGQSKIAEYFSRMSVACHGAERDTGHTGPFFNLLWALPAVAKSGPHASGAWMEEFSWHYDLARRWDGTFLYQGAPSARPEAYNNWDCTGLYLIGLAQGEGKTYFTGRKKPDVPQIDRATAVKLLDDGRGWSNNDRHSFHDSLSPEELVKRLSNWSPTVRERAAMALGKKKDNPTPQLIKLLESGDLYSQYGACQALKMIRGRGAEAVPALLETFKSEDLWLRVLSANALAGIGQPAKSTVPVLLERLTQSGGKDDPRNMEQRYLSFALFNQRGGLLGQSLEGIDREMLYKAVRAGLHNEDGRARGSYTSVYRNLSFEELKPLLPDIHRAIKEPAPSGIMFADQIQTGGLELFAKHHVSEGIELLADYARTQKQHASEKRIETIMKLLKSYGAHAQRAIPRLEKAIHYFEKEEKNFPRRLGLHKAQVVREAIEEIKASTDQPELIVLSK
ncbi:MAG: DUF6288 domain-containing protein [Akkermansiaceae bacterium]